MSKIFSMTFLFLSMPVLASPNGILGTAQPDLGKGQIIHCQNTFPEELVSESGENGYVIVSADYVDKQWCVSMNNNLDWGYQSYSLTRDIPYGYIKEGHADGMTITSMAASPNKLVVVMTQDSPWKQGRIAMYKSPKDIQAGPTGANNDEYLSAMVRLPRTSNGPGNNNGEVWLAAYGANETLEAQEIEERRRFPGSYIAKQWDQEYRIDSLLYDKGRWFAVSSKRKDTPKQSYRTYSSSDVDKIWEDGFFITDFY